MTTKPPPTPDAVTQDYWSRLREGQLAFQECTACGTRWLPPSPACPRCWDREHHLVDAAGRGQLLTWAVYHRAYHPAFAASLPYAVGMVELEEGPRLFAGIRTDDPATLSRGMPVVLTLEPRENGLHVPVFAPTGKKGKSPRDD